jgi:surfeit locus 1 family protein
MNSFWINIRLGRYRLQAAGLPTLATLLLLPLLVGLGFWQLDRAATKQRLQAEYDSREHAAPVRLTDTSQSIETLRFHRVTVQGRYETDFQILLDNRVHQGQAGYHVYTPLRVAGSDTRVLINRGWVAMGADRSRLPPADVPAGPVEISGVVVSPQTGGFHLGPARSPGEGWQPLWQYLDMQEYARATPFPVMPMVVLLDPASPAGGYVRQWARLDSGIVTHQGYALTWFSLAAALLAIYILVNTRRTDHVETAANRE